MKGRWETLLAWLAIQLATLCAGAMRVPLAAHAGSAAQHLALAEMIVVQLAVSTMLFPVLVDQGVVVAVALSALPFLELAAFLSATPLGPTLAISLAILMWICGLGLWGGAIRTRPNRLFAVAVLNCVLIGGPILAYLVREFSDAADAGNWKMLAMCDPLTSLVSQQSASSIHVGVYSGPLILLTSGAVAIVIRRSNSFRAKLST